MNLSDNTIVITGGTSGIGWALGQALLDLNNTVILLGRNKSRLEKAKKMGFEVLACDLSKPGEIEQAVVTIQNVYPTVNVLFNNAGVQFNYSFTDDHVAHSVLENEIAINVTGQLLFTQWMIPVLANSEKAHIINSTSGLGAFPKTDALVYCATKAAMRNFTTGLRLALQDTSIRVVEFIPPVTDTAMTRGREEPKMSVDDLVRDILPQLKKGRKIVTVRKMRFFLWIAFLFPSLAHKILSK